MARRAITDDFIFSTTGQFILNRLMGDRACHVLVTGRSAATGIGKTTLAIGLCRWTHRMLRRAGRIQSRRWEPAKNAHIDPLGYKRRMDQIEQYTPQLADELGSQANKLDFHSEGNRALKEVWAEYRYKNALSVGTLPSTRLLDTDLKVLADLWIHVVDRGVAMPHLLWWDDYREEIRDTRFRNPAGDEVILFNDISETPTFETVHQLKENKHDPDQEGEDLIPEREVHKRIDKAVKKAKREQRNQLMADIYENADVKQKEIADALDLDQGSVSRIIRNQG